MDPKVHRSMDLFDRIRFRREKKSNLNEREKIENQDIRLTMSNGTRRKGNTESIDNSSNDWNGNFFFLFFYVFVGLFGLRN